MFFNANSALKSESDYSKRFEPIRNELKNIRQYEEATELILKNWKRFSVYTENGEVVETRLNQKPLLLHYRRAFIDSLVKVREKSLNLRFISYPGYNTINGKDTIITFRAHSGDFNMIENKPNKLLKIPPYSIYRHKILYSTKPIEPQSSVFQIKPKFYYRVEEFEEY